jgi:hypothetical protein
MPCLSPGSAVQLTHLGVVFLHVISGHNRKVHCQLVPSLGPYLSPLSASVVPSLWLLHLLALCLNPQSAATLLPATPALVSSIFTDGSVKSGWAPKMLFDFYSPLVPRPYGAAREKGRGQAFIPTHHAVSPLGIFSIVFR